MQEAGIKSPKLEYNTETGAWGRRRGEWGGARGREREGDRERGRERKFKFCYFLITRINL